MQREYLRWIGFWRAHGLLSFDILSESLDSNPFGMCSAANPHGINKQISFAPKTVRNLHSYYGGKRVNSLPSEIIDLRNLSREPRLAARSRRACPERSRRMTVSSGVKAS